jgi:hypothetical protein
MDLSRLVPSVPSGSLEITGQGFLSLIFPDLKKVS